MKKKFPANVLTVLMSLLVLSILLYEINLHTECPACGSPFF